MTMYINNGQIYVLPGPSQNAYSIKLPIDNSTIKQIPFTVTNQKTLLYGLINSSQFDVPTVVQDVQNSTKKIYASGLPLYPALYDNNATVTMRGYPIYCFKSNKACIYVVGQNFAGPIAINYKTHIVYTGDPFTGTLSVINGFTDKVAVGAIFKVNPSDSGLIKCDDTIYPTNTYLYVDSGTNCTAQNGKGFEFNTWTESPLTNRNSSTPIEQSSDHPETITVDRFDVFTANFKLPQQLTTNDLVGWSTIITGVISAAVAINGALLVVPGWRRARNQRTHLEECIKMIDEDLGKSRRDAIEDKISGYYVKGKLSEDHRQMLKDKISEYYGSVKGSESDA
jgi:hypothetical protein